MRWKARTLIKAQKMKTIITGQILLILCCIVYLIWWYRGFRPGIYVSRAGGVNGVLLLITLVLGFAGVVFSLMPAEKIREPLVSQVMIVICGIAAWQKLLCHYRYYCSCFPDRYRAVCGILPDGRNESILCSYGPAGSGCNRNVSYDRDCSM